MSNSMEERNATSSKSHGDRLFVDDKATSLRLSRIDKDTVSRAIVKMEYMQRIMFIQPTFFGLLLGVQRRTKTRLDNGDSNPMKCESPSSSSFSVFQAPHRFYLWLAFLASLFGVAAYYLIDSYGRLAASNRQALAVEFSHTLILGYAYIRFIMHIVTHHFMLQDSPTFRSMPAPIQQECAFLLVDAVSGFFWIPVVTCMTVPVLVTGGRAAYVEQMAPFVYCAQLTYALDRFMHLITQYNFNRLIHHIGLTIWILSFLEWYPFQSFGIILMGAVHDAQNKFLWLWILCARYTRRHAKLSGRFGAPTQGIDHLFIPSSAERMAFLARISLVYWYSHFLVIPWVLSAIFFVSFDLSSPGDESCQGNRNCVTYSGFWWKVSNFFFGPVFAYIDLPVLKAFLDHSRVEYWTKEIFEVKGKDEN